MSTLSADINKINLNLGFSIREYSRMDRTYSVKIASFQTSTESGESRCILPHCEGMRLNVILMKGETQISRWIHEHWAIVILIQHLDRDRSRGCEYWLGEGVSYGHDQGDPFNYFSVKLNLNLKGDKTNRLLRYTNIQNFVASTVTSPKRIRY